MDISKIDHNFSFVSTVDIPGLKFYCALESPFSVHGLLHEGGAYRRMTEAVAKQVSDGVHWLHSNTAGGRVRFRTDSPYIAIHAEMPEACFLSHCALTGTACFDLYRKDANGKEKFVESFKRTVENRCGYEAVLYPEGEGMREYTINFPTYSGVYQLYIGLDEHAVIEAPQPYQVKTPVVFYGSSITQGACASRPGSSYEAIASRRLCFDYVNLGFSGNAKGEQVMADYLASLPMSVFVCDYDYNAPTVEHLAATHENLYKTVRKQHPDIPVIFMSRPVYELSQDAKARLQVIRTTYENAQKAGDQNVYLLDGPTLMAMAEDDGMVDCAHPNDFGFGSMAKAVGDVLEQIWK